MVRGLSVSSVLSEVLDFVVWTILVVGCSNRPHFEIYTFTGCVVEIVFWSL
jgi:hypothetical protein